MKEWNFLYATCMHKYIASISSLLQVVQGCTLFLVSIHYSLKAGTVERCKQIVP